MGEKFAANPVTGTGSMSVPLAVSPGRSGFSPQLSLSYDSGCGNGPFGFGWHLSLPSITRKTDQGLPKYQDAVESDEFILSGAEDLVRVLVEDAPGHWIREDLPPRELNGESYKVYRYRPRIEGLFARIERWTNQTHPEDTFWRSTSKDNITTWYGKDEKSRIYDPLDPTRIFSWLISESYDDKGNAILYDYKKENSDGVVLSQAHERNRNDSTRSANRYLKSIKYGNLPSRLVQPDLSKLDWLFEVVFDYGEHDPDDPRPNDQGKWLCRHDPFSSYRAGFEVRTYRLCQRVLMFHHFPNEPEVGRNCLVRSTDFVYRNIRNNPEDLKKGHPVASFIASVTQTGYKRNQEGGYLKKSLPPLEFEYSQPIVSEEIHEIDPVSLENLPIGMDGANYQWVDLDGEGISGFLTEQADAWFYKPNLGGGRFGPLEKVASIPSLASLRGGRQQLLDLAGDGQLDLAEFSGPTPGFYERTEDQKWVSFRTFNKLPNIDWGEPNLRFVDLDGDGHADILITEDNAFTWHSSLAEEGFGPAQRVAKSSDEEKGPKLVFADGTQSIYLADMSGDGLTDLARIRNGEVCYWPNLGYGRFGAKVTMDNAPWFDFPDQFDHSRIRVADIDGSGNTDILYLHRDGVHIYFNQSGNSWKDAYTIRNFPRMDNLASVTTADLLGNGTACMVWSSPLPYQARRPMRYLDLMGGQKPHLMIRSVNNLGAETRVHYAPSTKFYLADKAAGNPWITRLPFPVHVVERVETFDYISRNQFVTRYDYHHGYFDGIEREFRGFGMVEQWDTDEFDNLDRNAANVDAGWQVPPVHTKTWFHTGAFIRGWEISRQLADEYFGAPQDDAEFDIWARENLLDDTVLPALNLGAEEEREACRSLKGAMLRQEVYADDGSEKAGIPYTVTEQNFTIRCLQPEAGNPHAVFFTHAREAISYHYERNLSDPRITHAMTLEADDFGNVRKSLAIGYGRTHSPLSEERDRKKQTTTLITYTENDFTKAIDDVAKNPNIYRAPLPIETRTYELTGFKPENSDARFSFDEFARGDFASLNSAGSIDYEKTANPDQQQKRLIEKVRTLYRKDDLTGFLPYDGDVSLVSLALPGETYKMALTPGLISDVFHRPLDLIRPPDAPPPENLLPAPADVLPTNVSGGGYVDLDGDGNWWIPSGQVFYSPDAEDSPAEELQYAREYFFQPLRYRDPFGETTTVAFDEYCLLAVETTDPLDNRVTVGERDEHGNLTARGNDYRVLQPRLVMDPNRNRVEAVFDALGMVAGTSVRGKPEENLGDSLEDFEADLSEDQVNDFLNSNEPHDVAPGLLSKASTRIIYDLDRFFTTRQLHPDDPEQWQPVYAATLARETHHSDPLPPEGLKIQISFSYSDGFGREIQKKIQAEPEKIRGVKGPPRWVGSGWTIFNNKGKPVRQYEPFFDDTHDFKFAKIAGVSPVLFYDPVERVIATLHPNHTYEKVVFDPWEQITWDVNDTVALDPRTDPDIDIFTAEYFKLQPVDWKTWLQERGVDPENPPRDLPNLDPEKQAAVRTLIHAATPADAHLDTLGRSFLTVAHNKFIRKQNGDEIPVDEKYLTRIALDIEGNQREVIDAKDRLVMRYRYDMLGNRIHQASMEAGERWLLNNVTGQPLRAWDSRGHTFRTAYDQLRRPTGSYLQTGVGAEVLIERTIYGETQQQPETSNLRGKVFQVCDQAGVVTNNAYDFKGNLLSSQRQLAVEYKATLNWAADVPLAAETYVSLTRYDALNRSIELTAPDNSVIRPTYNEANLLERMEGNLSGAANVTTFVQGIDYDAKGKRQMIEYCIKDDFGADQIVRTRYKYDPDTFRLTRLHTERPYFPVNEQSLQDLHYTYDPTGNITHIRDEAQQTIYFRNQRVEPSGEYTYDAVYRLLEATGREHLGQLGEAPIPHSYNDAPRTGLLHPSDGNAMGRYVERYVYDASGNMLSMQHRGSDSVSPGWTRNYTCNEASLLEPDKQSNRLTSTTIGGTTEINSAAGDGYDVHGNMLHMPHLQAMQWDFHDQLQMTRRQRVNEEDADGALHHGESTWYVYDAGGQRVRKVTESAGGQIKEELVYLGGYEIYRRYGAQPLVRETLHVMDDKQRIALVETHTQSNEPGVPHQLIRYQFGNHLGSASLELSDHAQIISYEEYTPYGSTSYQAVRSQTETPKRYRYTGKERDEQSGLHYHGARYYAAWIERWINCDPISLKGGTNIYIYAINNPVHQYDPQGQAPVESENSPSNRNMFFDALKNRIKEEITWKVDTQQRLEKALIMADLAQDVYEDKSNDLLTHDYRRLTKEEIVQNLGIYEDLENGDYGFFSALYYNESTNDYVLAFRGTEGFTNIPDNLKTNLPQAAGIPTAQYENAIRLAIKVNKALEGKSNLTFTGHSLGGGLASAASLATGKDAYTFNAAGLHFLTLQWHVLTSDTNDLSRIKGNISAYYVKCEFLSVTQELWFLPEAKGQRIELEGPDYALNPFTRHGISTARRSLFNASFKAWEEKRQLINLDKLLK